MNREKELAKNTLILSVGKLSTQLVQFLLLPLYTALLAREEYGLVDLFNTCITLLVPLFNWQFDNGLFRFLVDCRNDAKRQTSVFSTVVISNFIQIALYLAFYVCFQSLIQSEYKIFLAVDVAVNILLNSIMQFARGTGKNGSYAISSFISVSFGVVLNVVFVAVLRMGALGMFTATVIAKVCALLYLLFSQRIWRYFRPRAWNKTLFSAILRYSIPLIPNALSWWVINASDRSIISYALSVAANGIYAVANKFSAVVVMIYGVFNMAWTESVTLHLNDEDRDVFLSHTINSAFMLFASACVGSIACMPFVFPLLVNAQYGDAYDQIPILMMAVLCQVVVGLYSTIYVALKKTTEIAKTSLFAAIINIVVDILLIRYIGLYAASVSTLVAFLSMLLYRYYDIKKYANVPLRTVNVLKVVIVSGIAIASFYINNAWLSCFVLVIVAAFAVKENWSLMQSCLKSIKGKLFKR